MVVGPASHAFLEGGSMVAAEARSFLAEPHLSPPLLPGVHAIQHFLLRLWMLREPEVPGHDHHGVKVLDGKDKHSHDDTTLFRQEDLTAWIVFTGVFFALVIFDNAVLHRKAEKLSLLQAVLFTTFWIACAGMFCIYVWSTRGAVDAFSWGTGYILEWMLSIDNLFVFHRIFEVFKTPDDQKHKPLFYGIIGAIVFRMGFFLVGELMMKHVWWIHFVFGAFLIYTGIKAIQIDDDEEESPDQGWLFQVILSRISYVDRYDKNGRFFVPVIVNKDGEEEYLEDGADTPCLSPRKAQEAVVEWRATRLMLVVVCLEITDLIFAVDSVSAIVAQIPDLFLAYTACVFAMLGLRALFFAIDELVKIFSLLNYGVAFILIFLGLKLILKSWVHFPPEVVCAILISTLLLSVFASLVKEKMLQADADVDTEDTRESNPELTSAPGSARRHTESARS
jgi:tellurite resistance protein TerC